MRRVLLPVFLLLGSGLGLWLLTRLFEEGPAPDAEPEWDTVETDAPTSEPPSSKRRLLQAFIPFSPADLDDGNVPRNAIREERPDGSRIYVTSIGPIALSAYFADRGDREIVKQLGKAMRNVERLRKAVEPDAEPWSFTSLGLAGCYLRHPKFNLLITDRTFLEARRVVARDPAAEIEAIRTAVAALMKEVRASTVVDAWMTKALDTFLSLLDDPPSDEPKVGADPDFARQVVSDPAWLRHVVPAASATARQALVEAVRTARALSPRESFARRPLFLTVLGDAWSVRGEHLSLGPFSLYVRTPPMPFQSRFRRRVLRSCRVIYMLRDRADPIADPGLLRHAEAFLYREGTLLAVWSYKKRLSYVYRSWRRAFPYFRLPAVDGHWPPHIPIVGADGTLYGLGTEHGFLRPPQNGSRAEAERFVDDAASVLPTAAHLDLLQQYFVRYCFDSPSIAIPQMVGTRENSADIHQTVQQLLATSAGGVCRGDCDDFAELCHRVARHQSRLAHVINLPGHLATMWAKKREKDWCAYVLQTGTTLEFRGPTLHDALRKAYLDLAPDEPYDRDSVSLSLRFAGENTRSKFNLPARVFEDADYAKTMVALQGDWHAWRYLSILRTVRRLAADDQSAGMLNEHAAICAVLDLDAEAADMRKRLVAAASDLESRVLRKIEWAESSLRAERRAEAEAVVDEILEKDLPALAPELGLRTLAIAEQLVDTLSFDAPLATRALQRTLELDVPVLKGSLADLLRPDVPPERWRKHEHHKRLRRIVSDLAWEFVGATAEARESKETQVSKRLETIAQPIDLWLARYALDGVEKPALRAWAWVLRAQRLAASDPDFVDRILAAKPLSKAPAAEGPSAETIASWARTSVRWMATSLTGLVGTKKAPDPKRAGRLLEALAEATREQRRAGLQDARGMELHQRGCLAAALIARDARGVRDALIEVRLLSNRFDTSRTAIMLGHHARHADAAWWQRIIRMWIDVMPTGTHDFRIVWAAHSVGALEHAKAMAALAASRSPENPAQQEEARLFTEFVAKGGNAEALRTKTASASSGG